jgi:hypothetical protein
MPGGVFYYAAESEADIPVRIEAAKRGKFNVALSARSMAGQAVSDRLPIAWASDIPPLNTSEGLRKIMATAADVADALKRRGSAGLSTIIIDTLSAAFSVEDEQSNAEAAKIVKVLKHIADETGTLVLTIAHHGKDAGRGVRGASAYSANVDTILAITGDVNTTTGAVSNRRLSLTKTKRAERGWNCRFDLKIEPLGTDEDGDLISSCYVEAFTELEPSQPATRPLPESAFILLRALDEVLSSGKTHDLQVRGDGPNIKAVELRSVRREFDRLYVTGDDDKRSRSAKNTQWKRGLTRIQDDRIVGCETAGNVELIWKA